MHRAHRLKSVDINYLWREMVTAHTLGSWWTTPTVHDCDLPQLTRTQTSEQECSDLTASNRRPSTLYSCNTPHNFPWGSQPCDFWGSTEQAQTRDEQWTGPGSGSTTNFCGFGLDPDCRARFQFRPDAEMKRYLFTLRIEIVVFPERSQLVLSSHVPYCVAEIAKVDRFHIETCQCFKECFWRIVERKCQHRHTWKEATVRYN